MSARSLHILLLEDHADSAFAFSRVLASDGHKVSVARTVREAERLGSNHHTFDVLLCDIELPDGQGFGILKLLQTNRPQTRGIIVSAHDDKAHRDTAKSEGYAAYLVKPVTADLLNTTLMRVTRQVGDLSSSDTGHHSPPSQF